MQRTTKFLWKPIKVKVRGEVKEGYVRTQWNHRYFSFDKGETQAAQAREAWDKHMEVMYETTERNRSS